MTTSNNRTIVSFVVACAFVGGCGLTSEDPSGTPNDPASGGQAGSGAMDGKGTGGAAGAAADAGTSGPLALTLSSTNMTKDGGSHLFPTDISGGLASLNFRIENHAAEPLVVSLSYEPKAPDGGWIIIAPSALDLDQIAVDPGAHEVVGFAFDRPAEQGVVLDFKLRATQHGTKAVLGETEVRIVTVP